MTDNSLLSMDPITNTSDFDPTKNAPVVANAWGQGQGTASNLPPASTAPDDPSKTGGFATPLPTAALKTGAAAGLDDVYQSTGEAIGHVTGMVQQAYLEGQQASQNALASAQAEAQAIIKQGAITSQIQTQDGLQQAKQAADNATAAANIGITGTTAATTDAQIHASMDAINQNTQKLDQATSVGFFDDPFTHIWNNAIIVPQIQEKIAGQVEGLKAQVAGITAQTTALGAAEQGNAAVDSVYTTQRAGLMGQKALADAQVQSYAPISKAIQLQISALGQTGQDARDLITAQEALVRNAQNQDSKTVDTGIKTIKEQQLAAEFAQQKQDTDSVNLARSLFGEGPILSAATMPATMREANLQIANNFRTSGGLGDPVAAVNLLQKGGYGPGNLVGAQGQTVQDINNTKSAVLQKLLTTPDDSGRTPSLKEANELLGVGVQQSYLNRQKTPLQDDAQNQDPLFGPKPLTSLIDAPAINGGPAGSTNPILQAMRPMITGADGKTISSVPLRFTNAAQHASQLIADGTLTPEQAAKSMGDIARTVQAQNDIAHGFKRFGIPQDQSQYTVSLKNPTALFGGNENVDMYNPAQVMRYLKKLTPSNSPALGGSADNFLNK